MSKRHVPARWPLLLLALPAGVATWSGWVGLGEKTGFGMVKPLPGISDFEINTAISLPIGVETYAAYALGTWLSSSPVVSAATRRFAKLSSIGSLLLGMLGQVAYHLLQVADFKTAPVWIVTVVSCLPVLVLGMGAALGHLLARDSQKYQEPEDVPSLTVSATPLSEEAVRALATARYWAAHRGHSIDLSPDLMGTLALAEGPADVFTAKSWDAFTSATVAEALAVPAGVQNWTGVPGGTGAAGVPSGTPGVEDAGSDSTNVERVDSPLGELAAVPAELLPSPAQTQVLVPAPDAMWATAAERYAAELAEGQTPAVSRLKRDLKIGQPRAVKVRAYLTQLAES